MIKDPVLRVPPLEESFHDDPEVVRRAVTEDYAAHVVPKSARSGRWSMAMAWYALASAMAWLITGGLAAVQVGPADALIGCALSVGAYSVLCAAMATYSVRSGTSINLFSRMLFGFGGGSIATLVLYLIATFYATFEGAVVAHAFHTVFGGPGEWFWFVVVVAYSVPLAVGGVRVFLDKFNGVLLPVYLAGLTVAVVWTIAERGYHPGWLSGAGTATVSGPGWLYAFTLYMGVWVLMMFTGDIARHARPADLRFHRWFTFGPVFHGLTLFVNAAVGIFLAEHLVTGALTELSAVDGMLVMMGVWAVVFIWVTQTRINTANYYVASTNLANLAGRVVRRPVPRWFWVVVQGVVVFFLMLQDLLSKLQIGLEYSAIITVAWVGVAVAFMLWSWVRGTGPEQLEYRPGRVRAVHRPGVLAWVLGSAVGIGLLNLAGVPGATWYAPAAFAVSFVCYLGALLWDSRVGEVPARPYDPRDEVADPWESRIRCHACDRSYVAQEMDRDPSAAHHAICCECAAQSPAFLAAARRESAQSTGMRTSVRCQLGIRVFVFFLNRTPEVRDMLDHWDRTLQFDLSGEPPFHVIVEDGRARVCTGRAAESHVVFEAPAALFLRMMLDTAAADEAYVNKKYEVHGPPSDATRFRTLGERVQDHHPAVFGLLRRLGPVVARVK
ncbi:SCP2 sterol-binding domain-containing protein [Pseudonocardia spinosispora]|uniref:SCP2 sterol-binding domain-containing protein n=1 Tax=Pseudonocardia spinosispora TaxID=103441 RepID=UPI00041F70A2|nr:SCP2 sterol-binding domain-containing protein [Pseudonocardia spinosispora]